MLAHCFVFALPFYVIYVPTQLNISIYIYLVYMFWFLLTLLNLVDLKMAHGLGLTLLFGMETIQNRIITLPMIRIWMQNIVHIFFK